MHSKDTGQNLLTHIVWETHNNVLVYSNVNSLIGHHGFNSNLKPIVG